MTIKIKRKEESKYKYIADLQGGDLFCADNDNPHNIVMVHVIGPVGHGLGKAFNAVDIGTGKLMYFSEGIPVKLLHLEDLEERS